MGELIKNGVSYTTTTNDALSIDYDNTDSGLEANNVQDAVDELNSNLTWNYLGKIFLGQTLTFETPQKELQIYGSTPYFAYSYYTSRSIAHLSGGSEDSKKSYQSISVNKNENGLTSVKLDLNTQDGVSNSNGYLEVYGR